MGNGKVNFSNGSTHTKVNELVGKRKLVLDTHGLRWEMVDVEVEMDMQGDRQATTDRYENLTEEKYWTMDLDHKVLFLQMYMHAFRKWVTWLEETMSESDYEKEKIKGEMYYKTNKWYHYLQSYRIQIETVLDNESYQKYIDIYVYFVGEFLRLSDIVDHMTHATFWKGFCVLWKSFVGLLFTP